MTVLEIILAGALTGLLLVHIILSVECGKVIRENKQLSDRLYYQDLELKHLRRDIKNVRRY